jgi:hypothetical protein
MLDLFTDLTWQHQVLFVETIVSGLIGVVLIVRGFQRTYATMAFFVLWNLALFALLIGGADHMAWQYGVLFGYYLMDTAAVIAAGVTRKHTGAAEAPGCAAFVVTLGFIVPILALIVTGN